MSFVSPSLITPEHRVEDFDCGQESLNQYLKRFALVNTASGTARTFVTTISGERAVAGYYSIAAGSVEKANVPDRVGEAGLKCYGHNLESSRRFFPNVCTSHNYDERLQTIRYIKNAGVDVCCGGIIGMGETREDRCDFALTLREINPKMVPVNFLNPIPGTPFENVPPLQPLEMLKTIACFRFILPQQEIMIAGGRTVNLRDLQPMIFMAGASALMVGNYLTTLNQPVEKDLQMLQDLGLEPLAKC